MGSHNRNKRVKKRMDAKRGMSRVALKAEAAAKLADERTLSWIKYVSQQSRYRDTK